MEVTLYVSHQSPYVKKGSMHHVFTENTDNTDVIVQATRLEKTINRLMLFVESKYNLQYYFKHEHFCTEEEFHRIQSKLYSLVSTLQPHRNKHNNFIIERKRTLYLYSLQDVMKEIVRENPVADLEKCVHKWAKHYVHLPYLFDAIAQKNQGTIECLTNLGPLCCLKVHHVASLTHFDTTALEHAFKHDNHKAVAHLLHADFNIFKDADYSAIEHEMIKRCYAIVSPSDQMECKKALEKELFHHLLGAIESDNEKRVYQFAQYPSLVQMRGIIGYTPLHTAANRTNDSVDVVDLFISMGACVNVYNDFGETPLSCAVGRFNPKCVKRLLKAGASTDDVIHSGQYPQSLLELPVICGKTKIVKALVKYGIRVPHKYSKLAEKGWITPHGNFIKYTPADISSLLKETYHKQQDVACRDMVQYLSPIIKNTIIAALVDQRGCI